MCYKCDLPKLVAGLARFGGSPERFLEELATTEPKSGEVVATLNILGMAAAYSPNPDRRPLRLDLPCDPVTGELDEAVWARWLEHDPVRLAARHAEALRSLELLFLDAGTKDEYQLHLGARILCGRLDALGGHGNIGYRYDRSLPLLSEAIAGG
jgi:enterochelin esterase family protein